VLLHDVQAGVQKRTTITGLSHPCNHEITVCCTHPYTMFWSPFWLQNNLFL